GGWRGARGRRGRRTSASVRARRGRLPPRRGRPRLSCGAVRRPRVLINALSLALGGGRSYLRNLLRELARDPRGYEFTVLAVEGHLSREEAAGIPLELLRLPETPPALRSAARVAYEEVALPLRARAYDLLYCVADLS